MAQVGIGIIGFGVVGGGVVDVLRRDRATIAARTGVDLDLRAVVSMPPYQSTDVLGATLGKDIALITQDAQIRIALLLVGGTTFAKDLCLACLKAGKHVVTSNKALIAAHGDELFAVAKENKVAVAFEAAVAGGIPIIGALRDGLAANRIESITGILNGTTNFILTMMEQKQWGYQQALSEAQRLGYAEADPTLDVNGTDTAHKLAILSRIAFGIRVPLSALRIEGIQNVTAQDMASAARLKSRIKLLAMATQRPEGLELHVAPTLVPLDHPLAAVHMNYNGVFVVGSASGPQLFTGQGAGALPTASAVLSDVIDVALGRAEQTFGSYGFFNQPKPPAFLAEADERTASYARFATPDKPGILAGITQILSVRGISIRSIYQGETDDQGQASIELVTHPARGGDFLEAVAEIDRKGLTTAPSVCYRRL
ncbi:MAG TPA: homoserine dehydrogenase [Planctomycetes bacterium]|nr:homoserine dehydrogenase [Planctomycetota bacterium]